MSMGVLLGLWLLPSERAIGGLVLDVHTLLYAAVAVLIGFHAVSFSAFTRIFAMTEGLLPEDNRFRRLFRFITLEVGLVFGALLILAGLGGSVYALSGWAAQEFGPLDPSSTLRWVIPSVLSLALGCQIVLSSFFLSVLGLTRR